MTDAFPVFQWKFHTLALDSLVVHHAVDLVVYCMMTRNLPCWTRGCPAHLLRCRCAWLWPDQLDYAPSQGAGQAPSGTKHGPVQAALDAATLASQGFAGPAGCLAPRSHPKQQSLGRPAGKLHPRTLTADEGSAGHSRY